MLLWSERDEDFARQSEKCGIGGDGDGFLIRIADHAMNLRKVTRQHSEEMMVEEFFEKNYHSLRGDVNSKKRHRFGITIRVLAVPAVIFNDSPGFRVPKGITGDTFFSSKKRVSGRCLQKTKLDSRIKPVSHFLNTPCLQIKKSFKNRCRIL